MVQFVKMPEVDSRVLGPHPRTKEAGFSLDDIRVREYDEKKLPNQDQGQ